MTLKVINAMLLFWIIAIAITVTWQTYEIINFGKATPDVFDTIIALVLSLSLTINVFLLRKFIKMLNRKKG